MIYEPIRVKQCSKCKQWYPRTTEYFGLHKGQKDGLRPSCKTCRSKDCRQEYRRNIQYHIDYRTEHRSKQFAYMRQYNETHRKESREYGKKYHELHKPEHKAYAKQYVKSHPDKMRSLAAKRRNIKRMLPAAFTETDWNRALDYWHGTCAYCGHGPSLFDRYPTLHQEHHIPALPDYELIEPNPGYVPTNIIPACQDCNLKKHNRNPEIWIIERFGSRKGKSILQRIHDYFEWIRHYGNST